MSQDLDPPVSAAMSIDRGPAQAYEAYNQAAFRHFLEIERNRAERSGRALLLLLVELEANDHGRSQIAPAVAAKLFSALAATLREIDFMGWYRSDRVIGAVLTQGAGAPTPEILRQISARVDKPLSERIPAHLRTRLAVRVVEARSRTTD